MAFLLDRPLGEFQFPGREQPVQHQFFRKGHLSHYHYGPMGHIIMIEAHEQQE
jgi:hypothetical protein